MVTGRAGKVRWGCLISLAVLALVVYYGVPIGRAYIQYFRMKDEMQVQANFAVNISDDAIRRRLRTKAEELGLPPQAQQITIRRRSRPREVLITTSWQDTFSLPLYRLPITFRPEVRAGL